MKISRVLTAAMAAALLTSCAGNSGSNSQQAEEVIITPTEVQETTDAVTVMSETAFECFGQTYDAAGSSIKTWCQIWNDHVRTTYRTTQQTNRVEPEYISELVTDLTSGKYEESSGPFSSDHSICLDDSVEGIAIQSGMATVYGYDEIDNLTEGSEPAFCLISGGNSVTYLVPGDIKNEFDRLVEDITVSDDNIQDVYELPDHSYREITETEYKKDIILFVSLYSNWAEGIQIHGSFIDDFGYVYKFNFDGIDIVQICEEREKTDDYTFNDALIDCIYYDVYHKDKPYAKVDSDEIFDIYMEQYSISPESTVEKESRGCDMGQNSLYVFDTGNWDLIELRSSGDWERYLNDSAAIDMCERFDALEYSDL